MRLFFPFSIFRKVGTLVLHSRSVKGTFSLHARCADTGTVSPTTRSVDDAFSIFEKCADGVLREKNKDSRPFLKVDEVDLYPYYLGEVAFSS